MRRMALAHRPSHAERSMEQSFWQARWDADQIGFHQPDYNAHLVAHWRRLGVAPGSRVFVPLCGKSRDLLWLRARGHEVVGVEWSETAVRAFFDENELVAERVVTGGVCAWQTEGLTLYCGDFFALDAVQVGHLSAVFDRAALIALPPEIRARYASRLTALCQPDTRMLLVTLAYEPGRHAGPPFSVDEADVHERYAADWHLEVLTSRPGNGPRDVPVTERVYLASRR